MAIQIYLQSQWINVWEIDGILGNKTKNWVIEFQRKNWIKVDWLPGTETIQTILSIWYSKNDNQPISKETIDTTGSEEEQQDIPQWEINQEISNDWLDSEKLRSYFCESANNLLIEKIDNTNFFGISYIDKTSGSKIKWIIPSKWNWNSNIYMPWDRSGIEETMKNKNFKEEIINKNSQKARFIFEWDSDKIKNGTMQSARYNNLINNFGNMITPMEAVGAHPQINIIGHSRAGATVNSLIWRYNSISRFIILDWTYWVYKNVLQSNIPGKIFYTNWWWTKKYVNNYKNKPNLEVIWDYENLWHEQIVAKALFDDSHTHQDLFG